MSIRLRHAFSDVFGESHLDRELKRRALAAPQQSLKIPASLQHGIRDLPAIAHQIAEQCDDVEKGRFPAGVRPNQNRKPPQLLINGAQTAETQGLDSREHRPSLANAEGHGNRRRRGLSCRSRLGAT